MISNLRGLGWDASVWPARLALGPGGAGQAWGMALWHSSDSKVRWIPTTLLFKMGYVSCVFFRHT